MEFQIIYLCTTGGWRFVNLVQIIKAIDSVRLYQKTDRSDLALLGSTTENTEAAKLRSCTFLGL